MAKSKGKAGVVLEEGAETRFPVVSVEVGDALSKVVLACGHHYSVTPGYEPKIGSQRVCVDHRYRMPSVLKEVQNVESGWAWKPREKQA